MKKLLTGILATVATTILFASSAFAMPVYCQPIPYAADEMYGVSDASRAKANEVIATIITPGMTEVQKVTAVHDYIVLNTVYDRNEVGGMTSHSADGAILNGLAQCDGYSSAFKVYMDALGIPCQMVRSDYMDHAWNQVVIGGVTYEVDVTFDDVSLVGGAVDHTCLLLNAEQMSNQHLIGVFGTTNVNFTMNPDGSMSMVW